MKTGSKTSRKKSTTIAPEVEVFYEMQRGANSLGFRGDQIIGVVNGKESTMTLKESATHMLNMGIAEEMAGVAHDCDDAGWQKWLGMVANSIPASA